MRYRRLGRTSLHVSEIGLGCSGFWGNRRFNEKDAIAIVKEAFELGVNFFDTGHNYCNFNAEPRLGRAIKEILATEERSRMVISTKAGSNIGTAAIRPRAKGSDKDFSPDYVEAVLKKSIDNLGCGHIDIFQLHGPTISDIDESLLERLVTLRKAGVFHYLGVNTHTESVLDFVARRSDIFDMVLTDYNVLQLDREPVIGRLVDAGIGVVVGTVLAQGHLIRGKIGSIRSSADIWYLARAILKPTGRALARASRDMRGVLASLDGMSAQQAAFAYVLGNSQISSCVFGTTKLANLKEIVKSANKELSDAERALIREAFDMQVVKISD